jgi:small subunit ribosomal protein S17
MGEPRILQGTVVSDKMDKTIVVAVERRKKHRLYHKIMSLTVKFKAHDEANECSLGDVVRIVECRPLSRDKRWRLSAVITRGDVAEIQPSAIGREIEKTTQIAPKAEAAAEEDAAETADGEGDGEAPAEEAEE